MTEEHQRLNHSEWKEWGPYVSNREWGNVREDYSKDGNAWDFTGHDNAESYTYRWGEEGIGGICDRLQLLCFAFSFWNKNDKMIKERFFGLSNYQGNHGEDIKEIFHYIDNTPTHSYMKMVYKYPINAFPYDDLIKTNAERTFQDKEYELIDTGIFDNDDYFDLFIEYCKVDSDDIFIRLKICNRSSRKAPLVILPTLWYRNNWSWGYNDYVPELSSDQNHIIDISNRRLSVKKFYSRERNTTTAFCNNETNKAVFNIENIEKGYFKDGINQFITHQKPTVNPEKKGTKACFILDTEIEGGEEKIFDFRISPHTMDDAFYDFDAIFEYRKQEAEHFYHHIQQKITDEEEKNIQRQAFAGLLWNKQFYHYNVAKWHHGDPDFPVNREGYVRNKEWEHLHNKDIISMPDKWEYPWYATWDLAFHCVPFAVIDSGFAKSQLELLTKEWYMHPNGQLPAYEWNFSDVNPPVHAWASFRVFKIDENANGKPDLDFLEKVFQKLLINFTWWINQKDRNGKNIFGGGFLGLDNIGAFDRNMEMPDGQYLEQADGTSWMAMYALNMMRIAMELALYRPVYEDMAIKFFEHYLYIAKAMDHLGQDKQGLWNDEDGFFYDLLEMSDGERISLKLRSIVGLIPIFAVEVIDHKIIEQLPKFKERMEWVLRNKKDLTDLVSHWEKEGENKKHLMSILRRYRLTKVLNRMLDENEFLSDYGIRGMSKVYEKNPFVFSSKNTDTEYVVHYNPAESDSSMFGGNSNWRGPVWFPINFLIVESLQRFHHYYGETLEIEFPTGSGHFLTLDEIAHQLSKRLKAIFLKDESGKRPVNGGIEKLNNDPHFKNYITFSEYFHGDNGRGLGASHQCGWTATVAKLLQPRNFV